MGNQTVSGIGNTAIYNCFPKETVDILPSEIDELLSFITNEDFIVLEPFSMKSFDLNKKNELNGIDLAYSQCIENDFSYFSDIENALVNDKNDERKKKYKLATDLLNRQYAAKFSGKMGEFISEVFNTYKRENIHSTEDIIKLGKLLNYMYANCHIGIKP